MMVVNNYLNGLLIFMCLLLLPFANVDARERSCEGFIYSLAGEIRKSDGSISFGKGITNARARFFPQGHEVIARISGKGSCVIGQENNKCRKVAADAASKCANEIWKTRWDRKIPTNRCGTNTNAQVQSWGADSSNEISREFYGDIKSTIEYAACCHSTSNARSVSMVVGYQGGSSIVPVGEKRAVEACRRENLFTSNYEVNCERLKSEGVIQCLNMPGEHSSNNQNSSKRVNPFKIESAKIELIKFPKVSEAQQCPRKVLIRTTFVTNKQGEVDFKLHRSNSPSQPFNHRAVAKKINGIWLAVHERTITVNRSIDRSFMAESTNSGVKVRATPWQKLNVRCDQGHSSSNDLGQGS